MVGSPGAATWLSINSLLPSAARAPSRPMAFRSIKGGGGHVQLTAVTVVRAYPLIYRERYRQLYTCPPPHPTQPCRGAGPGWLSGG